MGELRALEPPPERDTFQAEGFLGWALHRSWKAWLNRLGAKTPLNITATLTPPEVAANTTAEQTFTVTGLSTDMVVYVSKPTNDAGLAVVGARVSAADTLAVTFGNFTGAGINPGSETYRILAVRA